MSVLAVLVAKQEGPGFHPWPQSEGITEYYSRTVFLLKYIGSRFISHSNAILHGTHLNDRGYILGQLPHIECFTGERDIRVFQLAQLQYVIDERQQIVGRDLSPSPIPGGKFQIIGVRLS